METGVARQRGGGGPADSPADDVGEQVRDDQDDNAARVCECGFRGANVERWWLGWFPRHECRMLNVGGCGGRGCRSNGRHQSRHSTAHTRCTGMARCIPKAASNTTATAFAGKCRARGATQLAKDESQCILEDYTAIARPFRHAKGRCHQDRLRDCRLVIAIIVPAASGGDWNCVFHGVAVGHNHDPYKARCDLPMERRRRVHHQHRSRRRRHRRRPHLPTTDADARLLGHHSRSNAPGAT